MKGEHFSSQPAKKNINRETNSFHTQ